MNANIILDRLPDTVKIGGKEYQIYSDFRTSILFETMMRSDLKNWEKLKQMLSIYYPVIPSDRKAAVEKALWFYNCGRKSKPSDERNKTRLEFKEHKIAYSFEQDAPYIYAAFMEVYGINLQRIPSKELHWWEFVALFEALPDNSKIRKIIYWRVCDTRGLLKKEVERINGLKKMFALKDDLSMTAKVSLAQRDQKMKDYVKKRFEEVKAHGTQEK